MPDRPYFTSAGQLLYWVVTEGGGLCPSADRLHRFKLNQNENTEFSDVVYHVRQVRCKLCLGHLELSETIEGVFDDVEELAQDLEDANQEPQELGGEQPMSISSTASAEIEACRPRILRYLEASFPVLARQDSIEDLFHEASMIVIKRIRNGLPDEKIAPMLFCYAKRRSIDSTRKKVEIPSTDELMTAMEHADPTAAMRYEARQLALSDIFREYVKKHECSKVGLRQREVFERFLQGEEPRKSAEGMGIEPETVSSDRDQNKNWLRNRVRQDPGLDSLFASCL